MYGKLVASAVVGLVGLITLGNKKGPKFEEVKKPVTLGKDLFEVKQESKSTVNNTEPAREYGDYRGEIIEVEIAGKTAQICVVDIGGIASQKEVAGLAKKLASYKTEQGLRNALAKVEFNRSFVEKCSTCDGGFKIKKESL